MNDYQTVYARLFTSHIRDMNSSNVSTDSTTTTAATTTTSTTTTAATTTDEPPQGTPAPATDTPLGNNNPIPNLIPQTSSGS